MGEIHNKNQLYEPHNQRSSLASIGSDSIRRAIVNNSKDFDSLMRETQEIAKSKHSKLINDILTVGNQQTKLSLFDDIKMPKPQHRTPIRTRVTDQSLIIGSNGNKIPPIHSCNRAHVRVLRRSVPGFSSLLSDAGSQMLSQDVSNVNLQPKYDFMEAALEGKSVFQDRRFA